MNDNPDAKVLKTTTKLLLSAKGAELLQEVSATKGCKVSDKTAKRMVGIILSTLKSRMVITAIQKYSVGVAKTVSRVVPVVGGVVGATFDCSFIYFIYKEAKNEFKPIYEVVKNKITIKRGFKAK